MFFEENKKNNLKAAFDKAGLNDLFSVKETAKLLDIPLNELKSDIEQGRGIKMPTYIKDVPFYRKKDILQFEKGYSFPMDDDIIKKARK